MFSRPPSFTRRQANGVIGVFLSIQLLVLLNAALPTPLFGKGSWPWSMFDSRSRTERRLTAIGTTIDGQVAPVPLHELFTYSRGFTPLKAYDMAPGLKDPRERALQQQFVTYLARRMAERQVFYRSIELVVERENLETGRIVRQPLGSFPVGPAQEPHP